MGRNGKAKARDTKELDPSRQKQAPSVAEAQWTRKGEAEDSPEMRTERWVGKAGGPHHLGREFGFYSKCDRKPLQGSG